jgi:hypothetical protein
MRPRNPRLEGEPLLPAGSNPGFVRCAFCDCLVLVGRDGGALSPVLGVEHLCGVNCLCALQQPPGWPQDGAGAETAPQTPGRAHEAPRGREGETPPHAPQETEARR